MAETKKTAAVYESIEELKQRMGVSDAVFEGIKAANGWKNGKQVEEAVFSAACATFLLAPMDGRKADKEAKG